MSTALQWGLWVPAVVSQGAAAILMWRRGLHRRYTAFSCYTIYNVCRSITLYIVLELVATKTLRYSAYFYTYWSSDAISIGTCFFVLHSVFQAILQDYPWLRRFASATFAISIVVLLGTAVCMTALSPGTESQRIVGAIMLLERSLMLIEVGVVVLMFLFAGVAAIPWRTDLAFGIALGFGIDASIELAAAAIRTEFGVLGNDVYQFVCMAGYVIAVLIWLLYIRAPKKISDNPAITLAPEDVVKWNKTLTELLSR